MPEPNAPILYSPEDIGGGEDAFAFEEDRDFPRSVAHLLEDAARERGKLRTAAGDSIRDRRWSKSERNSLFNLLSMW